MAGLVIIGFDFGMALTKCAVAIQPPNQSELERVVVGFQDEDGEERFHLPSRVWTNEDSIALNEIDLSGIVNCHHGLKRRLLDAWACTDEELVSGAYVTECVFFALTRILAGVRRAVDWHLRRQYPGASWTWVVNAATPSERGVSDAVTARELQMKSLIAQVLAFVEAHPNSAGATRIADLRAEVAEAEALSLRHATARRVTILRESLAAALFALQADDAVRGTWLTVDVGAHTTDTSLFFFSPNTLPDGREFRVAAYYAMASRIGGMQSVADALVTRDDLPAHTAHDRLGRLAQGELESLAEFGQLTEIVRQSIGDTLRGAWKSENPFFHLFEDIKGGRRCRFRLLLVGGGSCTPAMCDFLRRWKWHAYNHVPPEAVVARIPYAFGVLSANGTVDHSLHPADVDHPILAVACGLAQQPWEMPRFDNIPQGSDGGVTPRPGRVEEDWWGGN